MCNANAWERVGESMWGGLRITQSEFASLKFSGSDNTHKFVRAPLGQCSAVQRRMQVKSNGGVYGVVEGREGVGMRPCSSILQGVRGKWCGTHHALVPPTCSTDVL